AACGLQHHIASVVDVEEIVAFAPHHQVSTAATRDDVIAVLTVDGVAPVAPGQFVRACGSVEDLINGPFPGRDAWGRRFHHRRNRDRSVLVWGNRNRSAAVGETSAKKAERLQYCCMNSGSVHLQIKQLCKLRGVVSSGVWVLRLDNG